MISLFTATRNTKRRLGPRQNVEPFMRLLVKFIKNMTSGSVEFVWMSLDRPTRSIRLLQTDRTFEDRLREKRRSSYATNETNKLKICMIKHM